MQKYWKDTREYYTDENGNLNVSFELPCMDSRKSFYGKAIVTSSTASIPSQGRAILRSYGTKVGMIDFNADGSANFTRLWDGYSATTMRHVNSFLKFFEVSGGGKSWWDSLPVGSEYSEVS